MERRANSKGDEVVREGVFVRKIEITLCISKSKEFKAGDWVLRKHLERPEEQSSVFERVLSGALET